MKKLFILILILSTTPISSTNLAIPLNKLSYPQIDSIIYRHYNNGNYKSCIPYVELGRQKAQSILEKNDSLYADYTYNLALLNLEIGHYEKAESLCLEAKLIYEKTRGKINRSYANSLGVLGEIYKGMGQYEKAENLFLEVLAIRAELNGAKHSSYSKSLNNLALLYKEMGNFEQAENLLLEAITVNEQSVGKMHRYYAASLHNLAILYQYIGQYKKAKKLYYQALKIEANTIGKNHYSYSITLNNLAFLHHEMGEINQAEPLYKQSLAIKENIFGKNHFSYAISLNNLAKFYFVVGNFQQAEVLYKETELILRKVLGKSHVNYAKVLNNLARLYLTKKNYQQAWDYSHLTIQAMCQTNYTSKIDFEWSNQIKENKFLSHHHIIELGNTLACMYELLSIDSSLVNKKRQIILSELAIHFLNRSKESYIGDPDKLRLINKSYQWMFKILKILDLKQDAKKAFSIAELHKSVLLLEATKAENIHQYGNIPDSLIREERNLQSSYTDINAQLLMSNSNKDSLTSILNKLNLNRHLLKKYIIKNYPHYAQLRYHNDISLNNIQQTLQKNEAIIEYVMSDSTLYIFYIDQEQSQIKKIPWKDSLYIEKIHQYRKHISNYENINTLYESNWRELIENAHWCYNKFILPIHDQLKNKTHLIIVPDGELSHLPFETFLEKKMDQKSLKLHYLIEKFQISYSYSASLWKENTRRIPELSLKNGQLLAMAAHYNLQSTHNAMRLSSSQILRDSLKNLPAARKEVETLAKKFQGYFGLDSLATEQHFKNIASDYSIIHLAMHGILNEKHPPLSGLVFSEVKNSLENNFLQAYEISKMELNAELVVLSACQTGYGKFERGNGVASLARAFMYAGVPSLVVSLWQVDDQATSKIMKKFYAGLAKGLTKSEALRQAKLWYIENAQDAMKHPAYWSPFIQIGNSKPIEIQRKYAYAPWYIGIVVMMLVAGLIFWNRK